MTKHLQIVVQSAWLPCHCHMGAGTRLKAVLCPTNGGALTVLSAAQTYKPGQQNWLVLEPTTMVTMYM